MIRTARCDGRGLQTGRAKPWVVLLASAAVFLVAMALRIPSCYDSLWVDELHSSWTVWADLADVESRARLGNQSPGYFWLLWFWHQTVGDAEVSLRLSSVLLCASSCSLLVVGVYRLHRDLALGITAGLLLAIDKHSVFFGTELRPYAVVMLLATLLLLLCAHPGLHRGWSRRIGLAVVVALLFLTHYTSLLVVGGVLAVFSISNLARRRPIRILLWPVCTTLSVSVAAVLVAGCLEYQAISDLWSRRGQWEAFAIPRTLSPENAWNANAMIFVQDIHSMWSWLPMIVLPLAILTITCLFDNRWQLRKWLPWVVALLLVTLLAYVLAALRISALWHRRYLVGLLPVLAWASASLWLAAIRGLFRGLPSSHRIRVGIQLAAISLALLSTIAWQGTVGKLVRGRGQLLHRHEDWRSAVAAIDAARRDHEPLAVEPGLIETQLLAVDGADGPENLPVAFLDYLSCPVNNIYSLKDPNPIAGILIQQLYQLLEPSDRQKGSVWVIARVPRQRQQILSVSLKDVATKIQLRDSQSGQPQAFRFSLKSYGDVVVVHCEFTGSEAENF